ncbi:type VII secretion integral membrane protein EccD [Microbacterium sp. SA39]|uniref:type VII secretion integral membrane protein EccD n=1 Tax=Microbacterium sp. SA39 TaxID=1263625 RepID=UPI00061E05A4|nr:type VII secretion integral membrane protein EccD [Microbacterium sp. SA39]KJQ54616.1 hypothetical protein RS85_01770 [Microbacterium sp. SA39]
MEYTRITVIGTRRKADLVLPDDHPVDDLLPEIVELLDEPPTPGAPLVLTTLLGRAVDGRRALSEQDIDHGTLLRLLPLDDAPQAPDVAEVTEAVADATIRRGDRWSPRLTSITTAAAVGVAAAVTGLVLPQNVSTLLLLTAVFVVAVTAGALLARTGRSSGREALMGLALGLAVPLGLLAPGFLPAVTAPLIAPALTWALAWTAVAVVLGIGARHRGILSGAVVAVLSSVVLVGAALTGAPAPLVAAVAGITAALLLGLTPSLALSTAGVARLDDATIEGALAPRSDIDSAITRAFAAQTALALALTAPLAVAATVLSTGDGWEAGLAGALLAFVLVRSRLFPLAVPRIALLATVVIPAALWLWTTDALAAPWRALIGGLVALVLVVAAASRPSAAARARLRRLLGIVEMLAVIAMVPLLLAIIGVFDDLLGAFA